jgi:hypothetical protein
LHAHHCNFLFIDLPGESSLFVTADSVSGAAHSGSTFSTFGYVIYLIGILLQHSLPCYIAGEKKKGRNECFVGTNAKGAFTLGIVSFAVGYFVVIKLMSGLIYRLRSAKMSAKKDCLFFDFHKAASLSLVTAFFKYQLS